MILIASSYVTSRPVSYRFARQRVRKPELRLARGRPSRHSLLDALLALCSASEEVPVLSFDGLVLELKLEGAKCLLKIDSQGTEMSVLDGFGAWLDNVPLIQLESSLRTVYEGELNVERVAQLYVR